MAWLGVITNNGNDLLTRWVEGKNLHITRAAAGQGRVEQTAMLAQSALVNEKQTVSIVSNTPAEKGQRLKLQVTAQAAVGYNLNQFGVWARLDEEEDQMIALFQTSALKSRARRPCRTLCTHSTGCWHSPTRETLRSKLMPPLW